MDTPLGQHDGESSVSGDAADTTRVFSLEGKTAIVFGIGPAIGSHVARALADAGARVLLNARREAVLYVDGGRTPTA